MNTALFIPFAYDDIGAPNGVTEKRLDLMLSWSSSNALPIETWNKCCVLTAGHGPKNPSLPRHERMTSLAEQMFEYCLHRSPKISFLVKSCAWGSLEEMLCSIRLAKKLDLSPKPMIYAISSRDHLPRIRFYARFLVPKNWGFLARHIDHNLNEPIKEKVKIGKDLPRLIWFGAKQKLTGKL